MCRTENKQVSCGLLMLALLRRQAAQYCSGAEELAIATDLMFVGWAVGLMDKASVSGAGDYGFESWASHWFLRYARPREC